MKRKRVDLEDVADLCNLHHALWKAARGKRIRPDVRQYIAYAQKHLTRLRQQILSCSLEHDQYHVFTIRDPKPRKIVALSFPVRVLHHAVINQIGDSLERSQIHTSYACLPGRGVHAAVNRVQRGLRQAAVVVKIDIRHYFESISHRLLLDKLYCRFKGDDFLCLLQKIIAGYEDLPGKGLPIGSLTSQYFANFFLENLIDIFCLYRKQKDMSGIWMTWSGFAGQR